MVMTFTTGTPCFPSRSSRSISLVRPAVSSSGATAMRSTSEPGRWSPAEREPLRIISAGRTIFWISRAMARPSGSGELCGVLMAAPFVRESLCTLSFPLWRPG